VVSDPEGETLLGLFSICAQTPEGQRFEVAGGDESNGGEGTARLISAAPDLHAALEALLDLQSVEKLLTVDEVLEVLRISRSKLHELVRGGGLKAVKFGRRTLFRAASVAELVDAHEKRAAPARALALVEKP